MLRVMFTGGGTAGHVSPALAVWHALRQRQPKLAARWVGSERVESRIVPSAGLDFQSIDIRFSYRRPTPDNWGYYYRYILPLLMGKPFRQALAALDGFRPSVVMATGGYVSAPLLWAALRRGVPVVLLQTDMAVGSVNWHFAPDAARIYCANGDIASAFTGRTASHKLRMCGYPVCPPQRSKSRVYHDLSLPADCRILLAMGGSLGSGAVHKAVRGLLETCRDEPKLRPQGLAIVNLGGERSELMHEMIDKELAAGSQIAYRALDYVEDGVSLMLASSFYFGRCGAATTGELVEAGIPALLLPDPQHSDRQQFANAEFLLRRGQAVIDDPRSISGRGILSWLRRVWDRPRMPGNAQPAAQLIAHDMAELVSR